ncbi:hypothetical protein [Streptomyces sp. PA5.6]|uniref:hypothetical protein n=1 Tax=Streptomyces sp. PA5.6 TaxID=3035651 RepID=UPI003904DF36
MTYVLRGLAANPALPTELVDRLIAVADADSGTADDLAARADLTRPQAIALAARVAESAVPLAYAGKLTAADIDPVARPDAALALLHERTGRPEWARLLASDPDVERRKRLAVCPGLPSDVVRTLAADPDICVVAELASCTTSDVAAGLADHPHAEVRRAVAANEATPPAVLAALVAGEGPPARQCLVCDRGETPFVHDPHCPDTDCELPPGARCDGSHESTVDAMRHAALQNRATPADALTGFAHDPSTLLRWALAARQDLPPAAYARLAADPIPGTRADVAGNPAIDDAVIRVLADDLDPAVRRAVAHHPQVPLDVLDRVAATTRIGAVLLPRIAAADPAEVQELAASPNAAVRMLLARRRDLPAEVRDALAADPDAKVVASVAAHPGLSEAQLTAMADRHGVRVAVGLAANPGATPALLEALIRREPRARKVLRTAVRHPALPPHILVELLADPDEGVAEAAAAHPSLPSEVMTTLIPSPETSCPGAHSTS